MHLNLSISIATILLACTSCVAGSVLKGAHRPGSIIRTVRSPTITGPNASQWSVMAYPKGGCSLKNGSAFGIEAGDGGTTTCYKTFFSGSNIAGSVDWASPTGETVELRVYSDDNCTEGEEIVISAGCNDLKFVSFQVVAKPHGNDKATTGSEEL